MLQFRSLWQLSAFVGALISLSCERSAPAAAPFGVVVDTIGDTISVMTRGPGEWLGRAALEQTLSIGELDGPPEYLFEAIVSLAVDDEGTIYALDRRAAEVRAFDTDGAYLRSYGRKGEGPGELMSPSAVAVLSDGRVLVRDARNRRVQAYRPDGTADDEWTLLHPNHATSTPLWTDQSDRVLVVTKDQGADLLTAEEIVIHVSGTGDVLDTTGLPTAGHEPPMLEASHQTARSSSRASGPVPYMPWPFWGLHPDGRLLLALGQTYSLDLIASDGSVFRIGREYERVEVSPEERRFRRERTTAGMRRTDPDWRWNGPPIPVFKPPFNQVYIGRQGRIWTQVSTPTREEPNPNHDPSNPGSPATIMVGETLFDVFESDGTYLGQVSPPDDFRTLVTAFDGDDVWTVLYDELGVQRIGRFTLRPGNAS